MSTVPEKRYGLVRNAQSRSQAEAYLPDNYKITGEVVEQKREFNSVAPDGSVVRDEAVVYVIEGRDSHGWTLDGYVIPRYASGLIWCEEIDLSHPAMRAVPLAARSAA
jgi:hypothetical protein